MADYCGNVAEDPETIQAAMMNLVGPVAMSHNVYNHILFPPTQVSRNLSMPQNQSSGLIGGRSRLGENFHSVDTTLESRAKDDSYSFYPMASNYMYEDCGEEVLRVGEPQKDLFLSNSWTTCLPPTQDGDDEEKDVPQESSNSIFQDGLCKDTDEDNQIYDVEEFIKMHLMNSSEKKATKTSQEPAPCQESGDQADCSLTALQDLAKQTNEIIQHNRLLQQQIASLKKETTLQTKVLTKLLKKKHKRLQTSTKLDN